VILRLSTFFFLRSAEKMLLVAMIIRSAECRPTIIIFVGVSFVLMQAGPNIVQSFEFNYELIINRLEWF
jgi:hypothetical protein